MPQFSLCITSNVLIFLGLLEKELVLLGRSLIAEAGL